MVENIYICNFIEIKLSFRKKKDDRVERHCKWSMIVDDDNGERTEESKESCVWICGIMFLFRIDKKTKKKKKSGSYTS